MKLRTRIQRNMPGQSLLLIFLFLTLCFSTVISGPVTPPGWSLVFSDSFEDGSLNSQNWQIPKGDWFVEDGQLHGREGMMFCRLRVPGSQRIEYDAISDDPGDLSAILNADGRHYKTGFFFGFGSNGNKWSKIMVQNGKPVKNPAVIEADKPYHVICQSDSGRLSLIVNGELILSHKVTDSLRGPGHQFAGLYLYRPGRIDNVKLYARTSPIELKPNSVEFPAREVVEFTTTIQGHHEHPFHDSFLDLTFFSPSGKEMRVRGFYYGTHCRPQASKIPEEEKIGNWHRVRYHCPPDSYGIWKARFAPGKPGKWNYHWVYWDKQDRQASGVGVFHCSAPLPDNPGFVRIHPQNPYRWMFENGQTFHPVGFQSGVEDENLDGSMLPFGGLEGPFKPRAASFLPKGPLFQTGPSFNPLNHDVYFRRFSQCGFNLFRISPSNCTPAISRDQETHLLHEAKMFDEVFLAIRKYGIRAWYGFIGFEGNFTFDVDSTGRMEKLKRFVSYAVHRWGAYVDFWEILNEQKATSGWYAQILDHLRQEDPYHHPITTSWERPELSGIDFSSPHKYHKESASTSDLWVANNARQWKAFGKPVILGEEGHMTNRRKRKELLKKGIGGVWDSLSAQRVRTRLWTAYFSEVSFVFWNTSYAKDGHHMNIWLGPKEREYVRSLQDFSLAVDASARPFSVEQNARSRVRTYGLASQRQTAVYLHHYADQPNPAKGVEIVIEVPQKGRAYWYVPESGHILKILKARKGRQTLHVPPFGVDLALLITPDGPLDIDKDGNPNHKDPDDDNDGVPDAKDAFPLEPFEWADVDGDGIGDNLDADIDGDGKGDDLNKNGTPDHKETDIDGDGRPRAKAIPWDAFPWDPKEWQDSDGDGIGDNADLDDDNDGITDAEELRQGRDPLSRIH